LAFQPSIAEEAKMGDIAPYNFIYNQISQSGRMPAYSAAPPSKIPAPPTIVETDYSIDNYLTPRQGLQNLQNTCFFNSSIQLLGHIPSIAKYFLTKALPERAVFAQTFASLLKSLRVPGPSEI
jgi:ubiquitin C-terminal hydrolase